MIISGFPGVGKSTLAKLYPDKDIVDLDSSYFDKDDFPNNYIDTINILHHEDY